MNLKIYLIKNQMKYLIKYKKKLISVLLIKKLKMKYNKISILLYNYILFQKILRTLGLNKPIINKKNYN